MSLFVLEVSLRLCAVQVNMVQIPIGWMRHSIAFKGLDPDKQM